MAVVKIYEYPDPVLRGTADPVSEFDDELKKTVSDLWDTMYAADGIGLAGPQIGIKKQIIVIDYQGDKYVLINPEITDSEGSVVREEGCLSFPGIYEKVTSPEKMHVKYRDEEGLLHEKDADNFLACVFSHEIDHLSGRLLIDRVSPLKRSFLKKKLEKHKKARNA